MKPLQGAPHLRVASLQPSISLVLERLDRLDCLVACTRYCIDAVPSLRGRDNLKVIADSWSSTTESILSASPNLVLASVPYRLESLASILKSGCPVVTLAPHCLDDIYRDIRILGSLFDATQSAEALVEEMIETLDQVRKQAAKGAQRPTVYCEEWGKPLIHSQAWVAELVEAAGGDFLGVPGAVTQAKEIALADPDLMIFAWCGAGDRVPLARVLEMRDWQGLKAARSGRVYCVPDEMLNTPAHNLLEGLHALAARIHPEIFPGIPPGHALSADPDRLR